MKSIIIAIHGLNNKPQKDILVSWWRKSIIEGFNILKLPVPDFELELVYWADLLHDKPQDPSLTNKKSPEYLPEPYLSAQTFGPRDPKTFGKRISIGIHNQIMNLIAGKKGVMNIEKVSKIILQKRYFELDKYYHGKILDSSGNEISVKDVLREKLASVIYKYRKRNIFIIAHSMGSIIAYDVLTHLIPEIQIHTFVTMGSPLGLPALMKKAKQEIGSVKKKLPTPDSITNRWLNLSDLDDENSLYYNLRNFYTENKNGVNPFDEIVFNNYEYKGEKNPHKSFGYLRTSGFTKAINNFLVIETAGIFKRIKWIFSQPKV